MEKKNQQLNKAYVHKSRLDIKKKIKWIIIIIISFIRKH